jgi:streptomycin 3"-adenylyltransferase
MDVEQLAASGTVKRQLGRFVTELKNILKDDLTGIYLHGSLAMGAFNPDSSDIDLLVVMKAGDGKELNDKLVKLLLKHSDAPAPIEISFLTESHLRNWEHPCAYEFHFSEDWRDRYASGWRGPQDDRKDDDLAGHIAVLRNRGKILYGKSIEEVFPEVPVCDYLRSVLADLEWSIDEMLDENPAYAILNHCRTYAFVCERKILSKAEGGAWLLEGAPEIYQPILKEALDAYRDSSKVDLSAAELRGCLDWLRGLINDKIKIRKDLRPCLNGGV